MAITPIGTVVFSINRPFGRTILRCTWPTGSGRAATSRMPFAISARRVGVRASRSSITGPIVARAASRSRRLAARISSCAATSALAIASSAASLVSLSASANASRAAWERHKISWVVMVYLLRGGPDYTLLKEYSKRCFLSTAEPSFRYLRLAMKSKTRYNIPYMRRAVVPGGEYPKGAFV